jgi:hypothetical protein
LEKKTKPKKEKGKKIFSVWKTKTEKEREKKEPKVKDWFKKKKKDRFERKGKNFKIGLKKKLKKINITLPIKQFIINLYRLI